MTREKFDNAVINASISKSDDDYTNIFKDAKNFEVLFNLKVNSKTNEKSVPVVSVGDGLKAIVFHTSPENKDLEKPFGGMPLDKALEMASRMNNIEGVVIQSSQKYWIAITITKVQEILLNLKVVD
ncbi:hypothetical protein R50072_29370 [Simiduia litorea]|uniref:hypothetical protein n=1 Tax=Simiduia litorea TaxID=1435348 RepID=UPI0036F3DE19